MSELLVKYTPDTLAHAPFYGPAGPSEIAAAFWSLWWGANSKPTPDQIEAVQTACKVVEELTGESDGQLDVQ